jgi:FkbH-like protein
MNLIEALTIINQSAPDDAGTLEAFLACGFTPLHLQTFLAAHLRQRSPQRKVQVKTGLFGDLAGNIERLHGANSELLFVVIEWRDIDPRLGIRDLGGWRTEDLPDIVGTLKRALSRLEKALWRASASIPTYVCLPTLPLPPLFVTPTYQAGGYELQLRQSVASFAESVSRESSVRILNAQLLAELSPPSARLDVRSELTAGFPYRLPHASVIAELLATLAQNPTPKKGLITDLDDTLWAGILGEVGTEGVSWNLDQHSHVHGLYQQFLSSLASAGVLIAVASKNDRTLVEQVFERKDLLISKENVYPFEVHWGRKSESAGRILKTWNIGAEDVVFIDDSPMEVAEVKAVFPGMECIVFPTNDYQAIWDLTKRLRDLFGKSVISEEDAIRQQSIRSAEVLRESMDVSGGSLDEFLQNADAVVRFTFGKQPGDRRAFELINKTNQFNLNGKRLSDAAWMSYLSDPATFLMTVTYEDKYGPLGKIAALLGKLQGKLIRVDSWVMSCRAFSRRIEHQSLAQLFEKFDAEEICFDYHATPRNGPLQEFFVGLLGAPLPAASGLGFLKADFLEKCQSLHQRVEVVSG